MYIRWLWLGNFGASTYCRIFCHFPDVDRKYLLFCIDWFASTLFARIAKFQKVTRDDEFRSFTKLLVHAKRGLLETARRQRERDEMRKSEVRERNFPFLVSKGSIDSSKGVRRRADNAQQMNRGRESRYQGTRITSILHAWSSFIVHSTNFSHLRRLITEAIKHTGTMDRMVSVSSALFLHVPVCDCKCPFDTWLTRLHSLMKGSSNVPSVRLDCLPIVSFFAKTYLDVIEYSRRWIELMSGD